MHNLGPVKVVVPNYPAPLLSMKRLRLRLCLLIALFIHQPFTMADDKSLKWSLNPAELSLSEDPISGRVTGSPNFVPDKVSAQGRNLDFQQGPTGTGTKVSVAIPEIDFSNSPEGKSVRYSPTPQKVDFKTPRVSVNWSYDEYRRVGNDTFVGNFAMVLEFGKLTNGAIPAKIHLCLPDETKTVLQGSFQVTGQGGTPFSFTKIHGKLKVPNAINETALYVGSVGLDSKGKAMAEGITRRLTEDGTLPSGSHTHSSGVFGAILSLDAGEASFTLNRRPIGWHLIVLAGAEVRKEPEEKRPAGFAPAFPFDRIEPLPRVYAMRWVQLKDVRSSVQCDLNLDPSLIGSAIIEVPGVRDGAIVSFLPVPLADETGMPDIDGASACLRCRVKGGVTDEISLPEGEYDFHCEGRRQRVSIQKQKSVIVKLPGSAAAADHRNVPQLVSPDAGASLANGSVDSKIETMWEFKWKPVVGATDYLLFVKREGSPNPAINQELKETEYRRVSRGYVGTPSLKGWEWKVRAKVNGEWQEWSEAREFEVDPMKP